MARRRYAVRKDGRMQRSIVVGRRPDGKPDRKYAYGYTAEELEDNYAALRDSLNRGAYTNDEGLTVGQWAEKWFRIYKSDKEYNTRAMYGYAIKSIDASIGHIRLRDIKQYQVKEYLNGLTAAGKHRSAAIRRMTLVQMFDEAIEDHLMQDNPARKIKLPKKPKAKNRQLYKGEKSALEKAGLTLRQRVFLYMGMDSGLRLEEILAIDKSDVDFASNTISITKVVVHAPNQAVLKPIPKTDESLRDAPLFPRLGALLLEYLPHVAGGAGKLFAGRGGGYMSKSAFRRMWEGIEKKMNAAAAEHCIALSSSHITSHMLRHTFATTCYYAGVDIKQAQRWMGHADIKMLLDVYTHLEREGEAKARENFIKFYNDDVNVVSTPSNAMENQEIKGLRIEGLGVLN